MNIKKRIRDFNPFFLLGEPKCLGCEAFSWTAICNSCIHELEGLDGDACPVCAYPRHLGRAKESVSRCSWCSRLDILPDGVLSAWAYRHVGAEIIRKIKFLGYWRGAAPLIQFTIREKIVNLPWSHVDAIVAVPESLQSKLNRNMHPSLAFARQLSRTFQVPFIPILRPIQGRSHQVGLDFSRRKQNRAHHFKVSKRSRVPPRVVLVDDVLTTGATLEAATACLRQNGAQKVYWMTLFRTL